jgi:uncharacterized glyoxalase superfamily protein PhnB
MGKVLINAETVHVGTGTNFSGFATNQDFVQDCVIKTRLAEANMDTRESQRQRGIVNRSAPTATVVPVLIYEDVSKAIDWLCGAFGFTERLRAAGRDGRVTHAQLSVGEGAVMLGAQGAEFRPPRSNEVNQYVLVHVDDVDRHFELAKRSGARIVRPPTNMPFGERPYTAEDFAGHRWTFSESIADVAPEQWGGTEAKSKLDV